MTKQRLTTKGALLRTVCVNPLTEAIERIAHVSLADSKIVISLSLKEFLASKVLLSQPVVSVTLEDNGTWVHNISPCQTPTILKKRTQRAQDDPGIQGRLSKSYPSSLQPTLKYNATLDQPYYKIKVGSKALWVTQKTYESFFCKKDPDRHSTPPTL
jgi:hypothetical protein